VPETAIHKNGDPLSAKHEIRFPEEPLVPPPARDAIRAEDRDHSQFGVLVSASANARHHVFRA
jgi:hypothetical protein